MDFVSSEDEVIGVEHLLAEPECKGIVDCIVGFDTLNSSTCFNIRELPALEYGYMKTEDALLSSLMKTEGTKNEFFYGKCEEANDGISHGIYKLPDTWEDYLLDSELDDNVSDFKHVPSEGSCGEDLYSDHQSACVGRIQCGAEIGESSTASIPIKVEATCDKKSSLLDEQLTGVFKFRTKPRDRHVKRARKLGTDFWRTLSCGNRQVVFDLQDVKKENVLVTRRMRKPVQMYINSSTEQNSRFRKRKCGISDTIPKNTVLRRCRAESRPTTLVKKNEPCDQKTPDCEDNTDQESYTAESDTDYLAGTETRKYKKIRRKNHMLWSLPEVLILIEGVSKHGVGKWTEIKRVLFPSSEHRTPVDLKDKWRNLLRASCLHSQSKRGVERKYKNPARSSIPKHILERVEELAVKYPYPRDRKPPKVSLSMASLQ